MTDPAPLDHLVVGANRLVADIIHSVLDSIGPGSAVAVLVDPSADDWDRVDSYDDRVVVVHDDPSDDQVVRAIVRGAGGVVDSHHLVDDLAATVRCVRGGGVALSPQQARVLAIALRACSVVDDRPTLSGREAEILGSIAAGRSVKQTATHLGIAAKTVENLQSRLFKKLDVRNRAHAVARGYELGLIVHDPEQNTPRP